MSPYNSRTTESPKYEDAFGDLVTKGTRNTLDLPAFYDW